MNQKKLLISIIALVLVASIALIILLNQGNQNTKVSNNVPISYSQPKPSQTNSKVSTNTPAPTPSPTTQDNQTVVNFKIAVLGDEEAQGKGSTVGGFPYYIKTSLASSGINIQIDNLGHTGFTSSNLINGELNSAINFNPKVALVLIGNNDILNLYNGSNPTSSDEQSDLNNFQSNIDRILRSLHSKNIKIFVGLLDDLTQRKEIADETLRQQAFPGISDDEISKMVGHINAYNDIINSKAIQYEAEVVDLNDGELFADPANLSSDNFNLNNTGYSKMADLWMEKLSLIIGI